MKSKNNIDYTWDMFSEDLGTLVSRLKPYKKLIKNIYGVDKDGQFIALGLAKNLGKHEILYHKTKITKDTLVVGGIGDELEEFLKGKKYFLDASIWRTEGKYEPKVFVKTKGQNQKVEFPWLI